MFIAFALRYDLHIFTHQDSSKPFAKSFFTATIISYVLGLITTVFIMHTFQSAQPALLYLRFVSSCSVVGAMLNNLRSPACISAFLLTGWRRGLSKDMWLFSDTKEKREKDAAKTE